MSVAQPNITNPISVWKNAIIGSFIMVGISAAAAVIGYWPICISFGLSAITMSIWNVGAMIVTELQITRIEANNGKKSG